MMRKFFISMIFAAVLSGQTLNAGTRVAAPAHPPAEKSGVDTVIELVKGGMSESLVIKTLQNEGKSYALSTADLLRMQKAGVTENIINAMTGGSVPPTSPAIGTKNAPASPSTGESPERPPVNSGGPTAPPPDLPGVSIVRKRRLSVDSFDSSAVKNAAQAVFGGAYVDAGLEISNMIAARLQKSQVFTLLERSRSKTLNDEKTLDTTPDIDRRGSIKKGRTLGVDCFLVGEITTFGRDDKSSGKQGGEGPIFNRWPGGLIKVFKKEEKAVVGVSFRIVDSETSTIILGGQARGESKRTSKTMDGFGVSSMGAGGGGAGTTTSNFGATIIGEATADAVDKLVKEVENQASQIPQKPREIEASVAAITANSVYLAVSADDDVQRGDRFAILQINNVVLDPHTQEPIDVETTKVGELVVTEVREKTAIGNYGGQPLSADYLKGKGYQARLMSK